MNKVIIGLEWFLKILTTISVWIFKIPVWIIKLIPGAGEFINKIGGYKTVVAVFCVGAIDWMESKNWVTIGQWICDLITFIANIFHSTIICDPSWAPTIEKLLVGMLVIALRVATKGELPKAIMPAFVKENAAKK